MKLDFSEVKDLKNAAEGQQELTIIKATEARSKNGTNMLTVDMKDADEGFVRDNLCLSGPGAFKTQQFFKALGISDEEAQSMNAADFVGMQLTAEVTSEEYEGVERSKIKKYVEA